MKAIVYRDNGCPDVLRLVDRDMPAPGPGEVRVRVAVSARMLTRGWPARRCELGALRMSLLRSVMGHCRSARSW
jgi:NADPH:quinone reductase